MNEWIDINIVNHIIILFEININRVEPKVVLHLNFMVSSWFYIIQDIVNRKEKSLK